MNRIAYAAATLDSACFLAQGSPEQAVVDTILRRACEMLLNVWQFEVQANKESPRIWMQAFWDGVGAQVDDTYVYRFLAVYGEDVNPKGEHNVWITVQPAKAAENYRIILECP